MSNPFSKILTLADSQLAKNGFWALAGNMLQTVFVTMFFVILARVYPKEEFATYLVALGIYQALVAFSSMGLGQWYIRQYTDESDKQMFTMRYFKIQLILGSLFYLLNVGAALLLYSGTTIYWLAVILGTNIIFDNLIGAIKSFNIAELNQKITFRILTMDGLLRLLIVVIVLVFPISITWVSVIFVASRLLTSMYFIEIGLDKKISLRDILKLKIKMAEIRKEVFATWRFALIGGIAIVFWRLGNILASKFLTIQDVADFEIAFKVYSILMIVPSLFIGLCYKYFVQLIFEKAIASLKDFYYACNMLFLVYSVFSYMIIYSFSRELVVFTFGAGYVNAIAATREIVIAILIFPAILLQANIIVAMKSEQADLIFNMSALLVQLLCCVLGFLYSKSLSTINYSIIISLFFFHLAQSIFLINKGILTWYSTIRYYLITGFVVVAYNFLFLTFGNISMVICLLLFSIISFKLMTNIFNSFSAVSKPIPLSVSTLQTNRQPENA